MYKFDDNSIVLNTIKGLLHTFNLPTIRVITPTTQLFKDCLYVYNNLIVRANVTKKLNSLKDITKNDIIRVRDYRLNEFIPNLTKNFVLINNIWDSYSQKYLGDYLRFIRDYRNLDLMPLYNCFNNEMPTHLNYSNDRISFNTEDDEYVIWMVPVKFFKKYTIAINCDFPIEFICGYYSNRQLYNLTDDASVANVSWLLNTYQKVGALTYSSPLVYTKLDEVNINAIWDESSSTNTNRQFYNLENNLKLFIKLPVTNKSAITILEGDYSSSALSSFNPPRELLPLNSSIEQGLGLRFVNRVIGVNTVVKPDKNVDTSEEANKTISFNSQLLQRSFYKSSPFADRLIEYLFDMAITPIDNISQNITRLQYKLQDADTMIRNNKKELVYKYKWHNILYTFDYRGVWDDKIDASLYTIINTYNQGTTLLDSKFDVLGYVDKDVEGLLGEWDYAKYYEQSRTME